MSGVDMREQQILGSWRANAEPWAKAIRASSIASRLQVTNRAIIDAVCSVGARHVMDVGCGEGWLARALVSRGMTVFGFDAVPALIAEASRLGSGEFAVHAYDDVARRRLGCGPCDTAVCNFSLLGQESTESVIGGLIHYLESPGHLLVQTLHPLAACGDHAYEDGWRPGSWAGFSAEFRDPAPWYFRTTESWIALLRRCGFDLLECREPRAPDARLPASIIFICRNTR